MTTPNTPEEDERKTREEPTVPEAPATETLPQQADDDQAATAEMPTHDHPETGSPTAAPPPPVWTASTAVPTGRGAPSEPPARRVRVGQLIWAGIVVILGLYLLLVGTVQGIDLTVVLIGLVALLGVGLIVAALVTGRTRERPEPGPH